MTSERTAQDVLRELRTAVETWRQGAVAAEQQSIEAKDWSFADRFGGRVGSYQKVLTLIDKAIAEAPDSSPSLRVALEDLLEDTEHKDHDCGDTDCPVARARAALKGAAPDTLSEKPGLDVERLAKALFGMGNQLKNVLNGEAAEIEHVLAEEIAFEYARLGERSVDEP